MVVAHFILTSSLSRSQPYCFKWKVMSPLSVQKWQLVLCPICVELAALKLFLKQSNWAEEGNFSHYQQKTSAMQ